MTPTTKPTKEKKLEYLDINRITFVDQKTLSKSEKRQPLA